MKDIIIDLGVDNNAKVFNNGNLIHQLEMDYALKIIADLQAKNPEYSPKTSSCLVRHQEGL